jgi:hypothetical protein
VTTGISGKNGIKEILVIFDVQIKLKGELKLSSEHNF